MLQENIYKDWWGQQSVKEASNQQKLYTIWLGKVRNFFFIFVAWTVSASRAFVYNAVDITKIATTFLAKPPP